MIAAWDTRIQRRVAIKCLRLDGYGTASDPTAARDIPGLDEARTAAMLSDAHIVGVYDFETYGPMAYLIMEYVDGITLSQLMHFVGGALPLDVATCVFDAVAHALQVAHGNQVLHLDIKPDNVLINRQGQVKVTDFGLAQLSHEAGFGQAAGGTIGYMPLEQMRLEAPDVRTDEWALASLTYEMLMGENPFRAPDLRAAERAIEDAEVVIPSIARLDVGEELDEALFGALAIDREDRFESVALFADALMPNLGSVRRGQKELVELVAHACGDALECQSDGEANDEPDQSQQAESDQQGFADAGRLRAPGFVARHAEGIFHRAWAAAACGFIGFVAASNIDSLTTIAGRETPAFWGVLALAAIAGAVVPSAGAAVALLALCAAVLMNGAYALGGVLLLATVAWWASVGRRGHAQANCGVLSAAAGAVGLAGITPLVAGYFLAPKHAALTAAYAALVSFVLACSGSLNLWGWDIFVNGQFSNHLEANAAALIAQPSLWVAAGAWVLAALVASIGCGRAARWSSAVGMGAATALLVGGMLAAGPFASVLVSAPSAADIALVAVPGAILTVAAVAWPPPYRGRRHAVGDASSAPDEGLF